MRSQVSMLCQPRAADMNFERTVLHQRQRSARLSTAITSCSLASTLVTQRRFLDVGRDVFLEEQFAGDSFRAAHDGKRPIDDVRRDPVPNTDVILGQILLGHTGVRPIDTVGMRQMNPVNIATGCSRPTFRLAFRRLISPATLPFSPWRCRFLLCTEFHGRLRPPACLRAGLYMRPAAAGCHA